MWRRPLRLAERKALYLLAMPGAEQQDLRRKGALVTNTLWESGLGAPAACCRNRWTDRHGAGRILQGKAKAITATARKIAVLFYSAVRHGMEYVDPGSSYYETRYRTRVVENLHRRAKAFGFVLLPLESKAGAVS